MPMDVEWAIAASKPYILQARPITGRREVWNDSLRGDYLWSNGNLGEAIPSVMTPVTWSVIQRFMADAMITGSFAGHPDVRQHRRPLLHEPVGPAHDRRVAGPHPGDPRQPGADLRPPPQGRRHPAPAADQAPARTGNPAAPARQAGPGHLRPQAQPRAAAGPAPRRRPADPDRRQQRPAPALARGGRTLLPRLQPPSWPPPDARTPAA